VLWGAVLGLALALADSVIGVYAWVLSGRPDLWLRPQFLWLQVGVTVGGGTFAGMFFGGMCWEVARSSKRTMPMLVSFLAVLGVGIEVFVAYYALIFWRQWPIWFVHYAVAFGLGIAVVRWLIRRYGRSMSGDPGERGPIAREARPDSKDT